MEVVESFFKMDGKISNSTISFKIGLPASKSKIPLKSLSEKITAFTYKPSSRFLRGIYKMIQPFKATFLLYENGKAVIIGFNSFAQLSELIEEFIKIIGENLIKIYDEETLELTVENVSIKNIVYSGNISKEKTGAIDLGLFGKFSNVKHIYEPVNYPALYLFPRKENRKAFIALFRSGKFFISGEKSQKKVKKMLKILEKEYHRYLWNNHSSYV